MSDQIILSLNADRATLESVGGKGASLAKLVNAGLPVPEGFHITTQAYREFVEQNELTAIIDEALHKIDPEKPSTLEGAAGKIQAAFMSAAMPEALASAIVGAYGDLPGVRPPVAVRSSATAEDLPEASFAGQQESFLNVSGADRVLEAVRKCWSSLWTARAIDYRAQREIGRDGIALAVVVQKLVPAEVAGILFTANPRDGNRSQVQISAAWGLGDAVVGGRVTPDDYIVDKGNRTVIRREIADKQVMTVRTDSAVEDRAVPENLRRVPTLEEQDIRELTRLADDIETLFGMPMDIEWALADGKVAILQARPITGLPEAIVPPPEEWEPPRRKGRYMRASIIDFMPDPLSPLFATWGIPIYNDCLQRMMAEFTNSEEAHFPQDLTVTVHDYAYFSAGYSAGEWWALLTRLAPSLPRLIKNGPTHFRETALPEYRRKVEALSSAATRDMAARQVWGDAEELIAATMYHLSVLQVDTLGASAGSEGLFTAIYNRFFRREGDASAPTFVMGYDTTPIRSEKSLYDLAEWALRMPPLAEYLMSARGEQIAERLSGMGAPEEVPVDLWADWQRRLGAHFESYGHILYDLDFSKPVPAEDPKPELETIKMYLHGEGANPHERQQRLARNREQATAELLERARGLPGWAVRMALGWAQSLAEVREDSVASIGLAYPRLRSLLKELGRRAQAAGAIDQPDDIFWLEKGEIQHRLDALERGAPLESMEQVTQERKRLRRAEARVIPPTQIPHSDTYMGIPIEAFVPGEGGPEGERLKGVGASAGVVSGVAFVLHGPEDFDQMKRGGILVAKLTTPAWTPLFAMAGGVVTDIGGPLSHGSIVAREYGIPAVLGTGAATRLIESGQKITVDGDAGYVILASGSPGPPTQ
jgi:phosphohistidine swiveling domain-containing protein